jgi:hypothetical protein
VALVLFDGFGLYANGADALKVKGWTATGFPSFGAGAGGRLSTSGSVFFNNASLSQTFPAATTTIIGIAIKISGGSNSITAFFGTSAVSVSMNPPGSGPGSVLSGSYNDGTLHALFSTLVSINVWYYLEIKIVQGAGGSVEVRLDTSPLGSATGITWAGSTPGPLVLQLNGGQFLTIADFYLLDGTGPAPFNDYLGDIKIETLRPTADGATSGWTPNSGSAHYSRVNETGEDGDTSYVSTATVGATDTYAMADSVAASGLTILDVIAYAMARKESAVTHSVAPVVRTGGTTYPGAGVNPPNSLAYTALLAEFPVNPATGVAWTQAEINAIEAGVRLIA